MVYSEKMVARVVSRVSETSSCELCLSVRPAEQDSVGSGETLLHQTAVSVESYGVQRNLSVLLLPPGQGGEDQGGVGGGERDVVPGPDLVLQEGRGGGGLLPAGDADGVGPQRHRGHRHVARPGHEGGHSALRQGRAGQRLCNLRREQRLARVVINSNIQIFKILMILEIYLAPRSNTSEGLQPAR